MTHSSAPARDGASPAGDVAQLVQLPCTICRGHAVTLALPAIPTKGLKSLVRIVDLADSILGGFGDFALPELPKDRHPLTAFPPEQLSAFLGVVHPGCVELLLEQRAQEAAAHG